jgi:hypothetical protein
MWTKIFKGPPKFLSLTVLLTTTHRFTIFCKSRINITLKSVPFPIYSFTKIKWDWIIHSQLRQPRNDLGVNGTWIKKMYIYKLISICTWNLWSHFYHKLHILKKCLKILNGHQGGHCTSYTNVKTSKIVIYIDYTHDHQRL